VLNKQPIFIAPDSFKRAFLSETALYLCRIFSAVPEAWLHFLHFLAGNELFLVSGYVNSLMNDGKNDNRQTGLLKRYFSHDEDIDHRLKITISHGSREVTSLQSVKIKRSVG